MKKKVSLLIFASFFSIILLSNLVLADVPISLLAPNLPMASPGDLLKSIIQWIAQIAGWVLGGAGLGGFVFSKLLLFILLVAVLYPTAKKIPAIRENTAAAMIIAVIVSVLGLQFITPEMINAILLPYGTLAIAAATMIPLILYAYFVEGIHIGWIRKVAWSVALATFLGLWTIRYSELGVIATYFYGGAALMCGIMLVLDGTITRWRLGIKAKSHEQKALIEKIDEMIGRRNNLIDRASAPGIDQATRKSILRQVKDMDGAIRDMTKVRT